MKNIVFIITIGLFSATLFSQVKHPNAKELDSLKTKLETLFMQDQLFRTFYEDAEEKYGEDSAEMDYFWKVVEEQDLRIENELIKILDTYGWLGISEVGRLANASIWTIIQHSSIKTKEKYAPLMKASVLKSDSQPSQYARLIDRIRVNANKPQIYGSQITKDKNGKTVFFEIENPCYVNKRRNEIGLKGIESFAKENGVEWEIAQKN